MSIRTEIKKRIKQITEENSKAKSWSFEKKKLIKLIKS